MPSEPDETTTVAKVSAPEAGPAMTPSMAAEQATESAVRILGKRRDVVRRDPACACIGAPVSGETRAGGASPGVSQIFICGPDSETYGDRWPQAVMWESGATTLAGTRLSPKDEFAKILGFRTDTCLRSPCTLQIKPMAECPEVASGKGTGPVQRRNPGGHRLRRMRAVKGVRARCRGLELTLGRPSISHRTGRPADVGAGGSRQGPSGDLP